MLGASELPLRQGFACGKTLLRRKSAAPPCGAPVLSGIYTLRTRQKERHAFQRVFLFYSGGLRPPPLFGDSNARGRQSRPCAILRCAPNSRPTRGAAQKGRLMIYTSAVIPVGKDFLSMPPVFLAPFV